jgi:hypothetical protein
MKRSADYLSTPDGNANMWFSLRGIARKTSMDGSEESLDRSSGHGPQASAFSTKSAPQSEELLSAGFLAFCLFKKLV